MNVDAVAAAEKITDGSVSGSVPIAFVIVKVLKAEVVVIVPARVCPAEVPSIETTPLCKVHRNEKLCMMIERFEPFCMGAELGNAYSELNDPIVQRKLLGEQQKMLKKGDEEANPFDEDFISAIEIGMPPTGGLGLGIDRMVMLLTGQESIRDVILFPFMKPGSEEK